MVALSSFAQSEWLCCEEERIPFSGNLPGGIVSEVVAPCVAARCSRSDFYFRFFIFSSGRLAGQGEVRDCVMVCRLIETRAEGGICKLRQCLWATDVHGYTLPSRRIPQDSFLPILLFSEHCLIGGPTVPARGSVSQMYSCGI